MFTYVVNQAPCELLETSGEENMLPTFEVVLKYICMQLQTFYAKAKGLTIIPPPSRLICDKSFTTMHAVAGDLYSGAPALRPSCPLQFSSAN